jgi:hypothetical protein
MDKIMSFKIMNVRHETEKEFYLNPRDFNLNGKLLLDLLENDSLFFYLPFNEYFVILHDEFILIIDIKESISSRFKIISQIDYFQLYEIYFGKKSSDYHLKKTKKENSRKSIYTNLNFICSEEYRKLKNFCVFETKSITNKLIFMLEYMNNDFLVFFYDKLSDISTIQIIFKNSKDQFISKITTNISEINKQLQRNKLNEIFLQNCLDENFKLATSIKYIELTVENFHTSHLDCTQYHMVLLKLDNILSLNTIDLNQNSFTFDYIHCINQDIIYIKSEMIGSTLTIIQINSDFDLIIDYLCVKYSSETKLKFECSYLSTQQIKFDDSIMISQFNIERQEKEDIVLLVCKLDTVFYYVLSNKNSKHFFILKNKFSFPQIKNLTIKYSYLIGEELYVFSNKCNYASLNIKNSSPPIYDSLCIVRDVFAVKKFYNKLGFFVLGSNSFFKNNDFNICYFLPERNKEISDILFDSNYKIFNQISKKVCDKTRKVFFSFSLCEYIVLFYRFPAYINFLHVHDQIKYNENFIVANEYLNLLLNRLKIYINKLKGENIFKKIPKVCEMSDDQNETEEASFVDIKTFILHEFRSFISSSNIDDFNEDYEWAEFLNNPDYNCDICQSLFIRYSEIKLSYICLRGHLTFSCCVSFVPVSEKQKFYICNDCLLVYSENFIKICLVCQKSLCLL